MQHLIDLLASKDPVFKTIIETFGNPVIQKRPPGFASMAHIILEQQVSIESAKAAYRKLEKELGEITAKTILSASDETLRNCGVSRQKASYLRDMAMRVENGSLDFESFGQKPVDVITSELLAIKGVGPWSVEVYLMFCLQAPDIIPLGDIAIRHAMKELYGLETVAQMEAFSRNWAPYRTLASFILWQHYLGKRGRL